MNATAAIEHAVTEPPLREGASFLMGSDVTNCLSWAMECRSCRIDSKDDGRELGPGRLGTLLTSVLIPWMTVAMGHTGRYPRKAPPMSVAAG